MHRKWDFAVLRTPQFSRFVLARTVSMLGNAFGPIALSFGALAVFDGDPIPLSIVLAAQAVPQVAFILFGGVLADRLSQRRVIICAELLAACAWAALTVLVAADIASVWAMAVAAAAAGTASALFNPALIGIVPQLVDDERLQPANALLRLGNNASRIVGFALAGTVVAAFGPGVALGLNAASFLFAGLTVATLRLAATKPLQTTKREDLAVGWREFRSRQWLWVSVAQFAVVVAVINAYAGVVGPMLAQEDLGGARAFSFLLLCQAVGAIAGVLVAIRIRPRRPIFVAACLAPMLGVPMLLLAAQMPLVVVGIAAFAAGVTNDVYGVLWETTLQREVPRAVLSRVSAFDLLGCTALAPVGLFVAGPIARELGSHTTAGLFSGAIVVATAAALCAPDLRRALPRPAGAAASGSAAPAVSSA